MKFQRFFILNISSFTSFPSSIIIACPFGSKSDTCVHFRPICSDASNCFIINCVFLYPISFFSLSIFNLSGSRFNFHRRSSPCCCKYWLRKSNFLSSPTYLAEAKILTPSMRVVEPPFLLPAYPLLFCIAVTIMEIVVIFLMLFLHVAH